MTIDVTFERTDMELQPAFDAIIPMDISSASVEALLDGTMSGEYVSEKITSLKTGAFCDCPDLTYASLPNCEIFNGFRQFAYCTKMTAIHLPELATISNGNQNFANMTALKEISLPSLITISGSASTFNNCRNITKVNLPLLSGSTIGSSCFYNCYDLHTLILGGDSLNPLGNTNAFGNTGRDTENFSIYVPDDLVDTYKTATNWSVHADKIRPISELEA